MELSNTPVTTIQEHLETGSLTLDQGVLGVKCYAALSGLFGSTPLSLTGARNISAKEGQIEFRGSVEIYSTQVAVQCCLFNWGVGSERHAIVKIDLSAETYWQKYASNANVVVDDSVETLIDAYIPQITYPSQVMIFSSSNYEDVADFDTIYPAEFAVLMPAKSIKAGLNFPLIATIDNGFSGYIAEILSGTFGAGEENGLIYLPPSTDPLAPAPKPYFLVNRTINGTFQLNPLGTPALLMEFRRFGLGFPLVDEGEIWPQVIFCGSVGIDGKSLSFEADYDIYNRFLLLTFRDFPSLRTLLTSFCDPNEYFPAPLDTLLEIQLSSLEIGFDFLGKVVAEIKLELTTEHNIELVENILSMKPTLELQIQSPFNGEARSFQGSLSGDWMLGSSEFETSLSYPDYDLHAALAQDQALDVDALAREVFGITLPEIAITSMELNGNYNDKLFSFNLEITSDWEIPLTSSSSLKLQQLKMGMNYVDQERDYRLSSLIVLAGVDINIFAQYSDSNWQFEGSTGAGQEIPIGDLIEELVEKFGAASPELPAPLEGLIIKDLSVSFNTKSKDFKFTGKADLPVSDRSNLEIELVIEVEHKDEVTTLKLSGKFEVKTDTASLEFNLQLEHGKTDMLIATYSHDPENPQSLKISDLLLAVTSAEGKFAALIQNLEIEIALKDVLFAFYNESVTQSQEGEENEARPAKILFGLDISAGISLTNLPVVGPELPEVSLDNLQILVATQPFETSEVTAINDLLPQNVTKLPLEESPDTGQSEDNGSEPSQGEGKSEASPALDQGVTLSAMLKLGTETRTLLLSPSGGLSSGGDGTQDQGASAGQKGIMVITGLPRGLVQPAPAASPVKWVQIQKSFGPVSLGRIGVQYENQALWFLLDASFSAAGLTLSLVGLKVGSSISKFEPQFDLQGLGIAFKKDQVEIGGTFSKIAIDGHNEYQGKAILKTDDLSLSAIGSYADIPGQPSMFIYAILDYPLGGPPVFYVTGLAAGFGYNRALLMPSIEQVEQFPLIAEARSKTPPAKDLSNLGDELAKMSQYIPVRTGQYFVAAGVKFTSFKMIDSFAMLAVSFGQYLEICVLGLSTIKIPFSDNLPCLSEIQVAIKANYVPDQGCLAVVAQLTPSSYILSRDCHPTGGLAFFTWFTGNYAGDFALTVGGYHPAYIVPAHYPQVPPLAINWQVNNCLNIKGNVYFALTPSVLMAGGYLEANWRSGPIEAWFRAKVDFLIAWKPFYYDANISVGMGVGYTIYVSTWFGSWSYRLSAELGTNLHLWGPEFAGVAHIQVSFISFDIAFGWSNPSRNPIGWEEFEGTLLPGNILNVFVKDGLKVDNSPEGSQASDDDLGLIDPNDFVFVVDSAIPIRELNGVVKPGTGFGIAPMNLPELCTAMTITITRVGEAEPCTDQFEIASTSKNVPAALWGTKFQPDINRDPPLITVVSGVKITAKSPTTGIRALESTPVGFQAAGIRDASGRTARRARRKGRSQLKLTEKGLDVHWGQDLLAKKGRSMRGKTRRQNMLAALGFEGEVSR